MRFYGKKRGLGKKRIYRRRRGALRKKGDKRIAKVVKRILHTELENKVWISYGSNTAIVTATTLAPTFLQLLPQPIQGTGHSQRIGNEIRVVKSYVNGRINLLPYNSITNPLSTPVLVKMWVLSYKVNNQPTMTSASTFSTFFETNNSAVPFQGQILDTVLTVNKDAWTVHTSKTIELGSTYPSSTGPVGTGGYFDNSKMTLPFSFSLAKFAKKIKFDDTVNNLATNHNLWLIFQCVNADGSTSAQQACEVHYNLRVEYEDA